MMVLKKKLNGSSSRRNDVSFITLRYAYIYDSPSLGLIAVQLMAHR